MTPLIQLTKQRRHLFIALLLACFPIAQTGRAIAMEPDISTGAANAVAEQQGNQPPNHPVIPIDFTRFVPVPCAGENVKMQGTLRLHFRNVDGFAKPESAALVGFVGTGKRTDRTYVRNASINDDNVKVEGQNGKGSGKWTIRFHIVGNPNRPPKGDPNPGKVFRFKLQYTVMFTFENGKVTKLNPIPEVVCND